MLDSTTIIDYNYQDFLNGIQNIVNQIKESQYSPEYIVGIVRGGAVPAVHLSHKLKVPTIMLQWSTRDYEHWNTSITWIPEDINAGKKILLVDDIIDGGETIREILEDWNTCIREPLNTDNIKIASLIYNTAQETIPDFYDRTIDRNKDGRWFVFPWE